MTFPTTHWTLLAKASLGSGGAENRSALEELCRRYWMPISRFIQSRGVSAVEAEDLTQEFMVHILEKSLFLRADRFQGRFRSFLIGALVRFLGDKADQRNALKRGGSAEHISYDALQSVAESNGALRSENESSALFDREWALTILENSLKRARAEYAEGDNREFDMLQCFLPGAADPPTYEMAAAQLDISVAALKSEIHRLRRRFRSFVREEVAQTVSAPHEIDAEMAHLQEVLMDKGSEFGRSAAKPEAPFS
jgi:DNA-directed RNA polymerase specialized sigma24 family protein